MTWTPEMVERLRDLAPTGLSFTEIAAKLGHGVTRGMVGGKMQRLGIPSTSGLLSYRPHKLKPRTTAELVEAKQRRRVSDARRYELRKSKMKPKHAQNRLFYQFISTAPVTLARTRFELRR